jgi:outer membrane protein OmpA-like peptidoglycan-associated protein
MLPQPGHDSVVEVAPRAQVPPKETRAAQNAASVSGAKTILLTRPYQSATVDAQNRVNIEQWNAARVSSHYGALLATQPPAAQNYLLYFEFNGTQLTPESAAQLDDVVKQAMTRPGNEIVVTGYTDSVGTMAANDQLSLQRAQAIPKPPERLPRRLDVCRRVRPLCGNLRRRVAQVNQRHIRQPRKRLQGLRRLKSRSIIHERQGNASAN